jgi:serine/threonine protein phosphatase PrpC
VEATVQLKSFGLTDVGRVRTANQDAFRASAEQGLFLVCDGVSGHAAGDIAARHTAERLSETVARHADLLAEVAADRADTGRLAELMRTTIERVSGELHAMGKEDASRRGMGCTCTVLVIAGARAVLAHVGDSRCYLLRQGQLTLISTDHTYLAEALQYGLLTLEEAAQSPYAHVITRAVGTQPTVIVDIVPFDLAPGDTFLLATDGLHRYFMDPVELTALLTAADVEETGRALVRLGNERGGKDNMTAVLVRVPDTMGARPTLLNAVAALTDVELFHDLEMGEVLRLFQAFESISVAAGETIVREADLGDTFYVIAAGSAEMIRRGVHVGVLHKGTHFGEISLLSSRPRTASVRALEPCQLLVTRRDTLYALLAHEPVLAGKFFWKLSQVLSMRLDESYAAYPAAPSYVPPPPAPPPAPPASVAASGDAGSDGDIPMAELVAPEAVPDAPPAWRKTRLFGVPKLPTE